MKLLNLTDRARCKTQCNVLGVKFGTSTDANLFARTSRAIEMEKKVLAARSKGR